MDITLDLVHHNGCQLGIILKIITSSALQVTRRHLVLQVKATILIEKESTDTFKSKPSGSVQFLHYHSLLLVLGTKPETNLYKNLPKVQLQRSISFLQFDFSHGQCIYKKNRIEQNNKTRRETRARNHPINSCPKTKDQAELDLSIIVVQSIRPSIHPVQSRPSLSVQLSKK